jgi:hypothetical protein
VQTISISQKKLQNQDFHRSPPHGSPLSLGNLHMFMGNGMHKLFDMMWVSETGVLNEWQSRYWKMMII